MNLSELVTEIEDIVQDSSYAEIKIKAKINEAVLAIATGVMIPGKFEKSPPLPDLYKVDDIDTTVSSGITDLPTDFNRDVVQVLNSDKDEITINSSAKNFLHKYLDQDGGEVYVCAIMGKRLLYRDIPSTAETLTIHYYKTPNTLSANSDEPDEIPVHLHRKLIVGYVCKEIFDQIEDGIEDPKTNTNHYNNEFQSGLVALDLEIGTDENPDHYDDQTDYCA